MSAKAIAAVTTARDVAAFLDWIGEHKRANDVRRVCRSNDSYRVTLATLHRDNMDLRGGKVAPPPLITFAQAEAIGQQLHDHWLKMAGSAPMDRDDQGWGDVVQFVIRKARETEGAAK